MKAKSRVPRKTSERLRQKVDASLTQLERAELIRRSVAEDVEFVFKHTLTQAAAYESVLVKRRHEIHRAVAQAYEIVYADRCMDEYAAILARHYAEAGDDAKTLEYGERAGDIAAGVHANAEASANYSLAIDSAERLGSTTPQQLVQLYTKRGRALELAGQDQAALKGYERLEELGRARREPALELASLMLRAKLYNLHTTVHDSARGERLSQQALALAQQLGDRAAQARILWNLMLASQWGAGGPRVAIDYGEKALTLARELGLREQLAYTLADLAYPYMFVGQVARAVALRQEAHQLWRELDNKPMIADNLTGIANQYAAIGEVEKCVDAASEAFKISESIGNEWGQAYSLGIMGGGLVELAQCDDAAQALHAARQHGNNVGSIGPIIASSTFLVDLYSLVGAYARALEDARVAYDYAKAHLPEWLPWADAALARVYVTTGELDAAEKSMAALPNSIEEIFDRLTARSAILVVIAKAEFALVRRDYSTAGAIVEQLLELISQRGLFGLVADVLHLKGKIQAAQGKFDEAIRDLQDARKTALQHNSRRALFGILIALVEYERERGKAIEAERATEEARDLINYILDHTHRPELREPFLTLPSVRAILESEHVAAK